MAYPDRHCQEVLHAVFLVTEHFRFYLYRTQYTVPPVQSRRPCRPLGNIDAMITHAAAVGPEEHEVDVSMPFWKVRCT